MSGKNYSEITKIFNKKSNFSPKRNREKEKELGPSSPKKPKSAVRGTEKEASTPTENKYFSSPVRTKAQPTLFEEWEKSVGFIPDCDALDDSATKFINGGWKEKLNTWEPEDRYTPKVSEHKAFSAKTYSLKELQTLSAIVASTSDEELKNRARFILNLDGELSFAEDGVGNNIPSHVTLAKGKTVSAAGTIYFNEGGKIKGIDNKSGGYTPFFSCLTPVLRILLKENLLADTITLYEYRGETYAIALNREELAVSIGEITERTTAQQPSGNSFASMSDDELTPQKKKALITPHARSRARSSQPPASPPTSLSSTSDEEEAPRVNLSQ
jgi:hypothetical protein